MEQIGHILMALPTKLICLFLFAIIGVTLGALIIAPKSWSWVSKSRKATNTDVCEWCHKVHTRECDFMNIDNSVEN